MSGLEACMGRVYWVSLFLYLLAAFPLLAIVGTVADGNAVRVVRVLWGALRVFAYGAVHGGGVP